MNPYIFFTAESATIAENCEKKNVRRVEINRSSGRAGFPALRGVT